MLKAFLFKVFALIFSLLGNIFRKKKRNFFPKQIRTILINRSDRLGDAAVSLGILQTLSQYFKITILTSTLNDQLLNPFFSTIIIKKEVKDILSIASFLLRKLFFSPFLFSRKKDISKFDLYLDLVGGTSLDVFLYVREHLPCRYYAGYKLGHWSIFLDYAEKSNPVLFSNKQIVNSYCNLLKNTLDLNIDNIPNVDLQRYAVQPEDFKITDPFILLNISGYEKFRGPSLSQFAKYIKGIQWTGVIVIIDSIGRPNMSAFKKLVNARNIIFLERDFSIWELLFIASKCKLYIGSDSGITQLLQLVSSSIIFFGTGLFSVWKPYSANRYIQRKVGRVCVEETITTERYRKKIIYVPVWCRPCFDFGCSHRRCVRLLDNEIVIREINKTISEIENNSYPKATD